MVCIECNWYKRKRISDANVVHFFVHLRADRVKGGVLQSIISRNFAYIDASVHVYVFIKLFVYFTAAVYTK